MSVCKSPTFLLKTLSYDGYCFSNGGVVLTALNNRIILNQTVDERLAIAYTDTMPQVRKGLFTVSA